jgi:hypothetical protein
MTRPQRHQKGDRLMHSGIKPEDVACDFALGPFDTAARNAERKWGVNRLEGLVSPETAARYGSALGKLNAAIEANDPAEVAARAAVCIRGMAAMEAEATAAGHQPIPPQALEVEVDGKLCAILADGAQWPVYAALRPGVRVYTLREVANALAAYGASVGAVKDAFVGAEVKAVRSPLAQFLQDDIPFSPETRA